MTEFYDQPQRSLQDHFDTRRLADRLEQALIHDALTESERQFIAARDMFFIATIDTQGRANCSYRGGDPGFVRVIDAHTIAFPNYDGNGMYLSMGNVLGTGQVGMLFIDFEEPARLRVNGEASIDFDDPLRSAFPEAQFLVRVHVREIFANCPRYIHRLKGVERSRFVPIAGCTTPVPAWKTGDWVKDDLPQADPARDPGREVL